MLAHLNRVGLLQQLYFNRDETERLLMLSCAFSGSMVIFRILYTGEWMFAFLLWNLFLAGLPYFLSCWLQKKLQWIENNSRFTIVFIGWVVLLPNSFYILTDLFHLRHSQNVPLWFDLAMIFSFAWNGMVFGVLSMRQIERLISLKCGDIVQRLFIPVIMLLNALGIYIGRYLRYNSWDVLTNPFGLLREMIYLAMHPLRNRFDWSMIICFAALLTLFYGTLKQMSKRLA